MTSYKVLEFYSGIGGMHWALQGAGYHNTEVTAMEINDVANRVYKTNFPSIKLLQRNITSLSINEFETWKPDMLLMSPPCQPYTRVGLKRGTSDPRSFSFHHILDILGASKHKPNYFLLENVKGFEEFGTEKLHATLRLCGYHFQEFLLSPHQFGIPNSRLRFYLLAKQNHLPFSFPVQSEIWTTMPLRKESVATFKIGSILDEEAAEDPTLLIPENILLKHADILDIVGPESERSCCFTKAYSRFVEGTGSILCPLGLRKVEEVFKDMPGSTEKITSLKSLKLRYFSPKEVSRLMSFPDEFCIPPSVTRKQAYQLLGNSINVSVVSQLIKLLCKNDPG